ncbi:MAG: hypothetical protein WC700_16330 [Gemmatimonadaceae bacterium]|jgi:hypothetical protein
MSTIATNGNPFDRYRDDPEPEAEPYQDPPADENQAAKDTAKITWAAKMAASKAAKKIERERAAAAPQPDKPINEAERQRQKLANFIPDTTSLQIFKVIDGQPVYVGDFDARAVLSSKSVRHFIIDNLYRKHHRAQAWEIVHTNADGKERAPYRIRIDPDAQGSQEDRMTEKLEAIAQQQNGKPSQMKEAVQVMRDLKEMQAQDAPQGPQPTTLVEYMMMRDMMRPAEDPRLAAITEKLARLESFLSQPAAPIQMPPPAETFGLRDALALMQQMNAPMVEMIHNMRAEASSREAAIRDEIKEARKSASTGGHGGLEALRDQIKLLKEIEKEQGGGGGELTKLVSSIGGFLKDMKAQEVATAPAPAAPAASPAAIQFPPGFDEKAKAIAAATTDPARLEAALLAYQHIIASADPFWLRFHSLIVEHAKKGEKDRVREYVAGFLEGCAQWVPEAAQKAALAAFDAQSAGVIGMLAAA